MRPAQGMDRNGRVVRFTDKKAEREKQIIRDEVALAWRGRRPFTGPVLLKLVFIFAIPPSWPKALRAAAAEGRVAHVADPDIDQCAKQCLDALVRVAFVDDNQVCGLPACSKRYGFPERTEITIQPLAQAADEITPGQKRLEARIVREGWDAVLAPPKRKASNTDIDSARSANNSAFSISRRRWTQKPAQRRLGEP